MAAEGLPVGDEEQARDAAARGLLLRHAARRRALHLPELPDLVGRQRLRISLHRRPRIQGGADLRARARRSRHAAARAHADELRKGRAFADKWFPALAQQPLVDARICQREDSVDDHFIVQQHPELANVWLVGGGSGHGYKHGIMLGDYVAHRVVGNDTQPELAATFALKADVLDDQKKPGDRKDR